MLPLPPPSSNGGHRRPIGASPAVSNIIGNRKLTRVCTQTNQHKSQQQQQQSKRRTRPQQQQQAQRRLSAGRPH